MRTLYADHTSNLYSTSHITPPSYVGITHVRPLVRSCTGWRSGFVRREYLRLVPKRKKRMKARPPPPPTPNNPVPVRTRSCTHHSPPHSPAQHLTHHLAHSLAHYLTHRVCDSPVGCVGQDESTKNCGEGAPGGFETPEFPAAMVREWTARTKPLHTNKRPINQLINQPSTQSTNQLACHSTDHPINQSTNQSTCSTNSTVPNDMRLTCNHALKAGCFLDVS